MILPLALAIAVGLILGKRVLPRRVSQSPRVEQVGTALMVAMLVALGLRLALQQATNPAWGRMFGRAVALALGTIAGSVLFTWPCAGWLPAPETKDGVELPNPLRLLGLALGSLLVGTLAGVLIGPGALSEDVLADVAYGCLCAMMLFVGIEGGGKESVGSDLKSLSPKLALVPLAIAVGSAAGGCVTGMLLGLAPREGAGIGAGCGWYSYTTIILGKKNAELGSYGLLANLFREALSLIVIPLMARWHRGLMLLAPAGCTAMDTTLKMLSKLGGTQLGVMAFLSGMVCSLLVPWFVPTAFDALP